MLDNGAIITAELLRIMQRSGIRWVLLSRKGSIIEDAKAYAYGNTLVFPVFGDTDGIFLLAMTEGGYANEQLERYSSGLWSYEIVPEFDRNDLITRALEVHRSWF